MLSRFRQGVLVQPADILVVRHGLDGGQREDGAAVVGMLCSGVQAVQHDLDPLGIARLGQLVVQVPGQQGRHQVPLGYRQMFRRAIHDDHRNLFVLLRMMPDRQRHFVLMDGEDGVPRIAAAHARLEVVRETGDGSRVARFQRRGIDGVGTERELRMAGVLYRDKQVEELRIAVAGRLRADVGVGIGCGFQLRQILPHRHQARFETGLVRHRGKCTRVDLRRGFAQDDRRFRGTATRVPGGQVAETPIHCPGPGAGNMGGPRAAFCRGIGTGSRGGVDRFRGRRDARFRQDRLHWSGEGHHWIMRGGRRAGVGAKTWLGNRCTVRKATGPRRRGRPGRRQRKRALGVRSQGPCCPGRVSRAAQAKPASCAC